MTSDGFGNSKTIRCNVYIDNGFKAYPKGAQQYSDGSYDSSLALYADPGDSFTLEVVVEAKDNSQITYTWFDDEEDIINATGPSLNIRK